LCVRHLWVQHVVPGIPDHHTDEFCKAHPARKPPACLPLHFPPQAGRALAHAQPQRDPPRLCPRPDRLGHLALKHGSRQPIERLGRTGRAFIQAQVRPEYCSRFHQRAVPATQPPPSGRLTSGRRLAAIGPGPMGLRLRSWWKLATCLTRLPLASRIRPDLV
jgi:hypothetical protein